MLDEDGGDVRARIVAAATTLMAAGGVRAVTTRAVSQAAAVQPPTIYRHFGDKDGLLDVVAEQVFTAYLKRKGGPEPDGDAVSSLRHGIDQYVAFGLAHPAVFVMINAPQNGRASQVLLAGLAMLDAKVREVARQGRLKVSVERAAALIHAMATGTVLMLLGVADAARGELATAAREAVLAAVLDEAAEPTPAAAGLATTLRAHLSDLDRLTPGERLLLDELLHRIGTPQP